jgi:hypothetical protein
VRTWDSEAGRTGVAAYALGVNNTFFVDACLHGVFLLLGLHVCTNTLLARGMCAGEDAATRSKYKPVPYQCVGVRAGARYRQRILRAQPFSAITTNQKLLRYAREQRALEYVCTD